MRNSRRFIFAEKSVHCLNCPEKDYFIKIKWQSTQKDKKKALEKLGNLKDQIKIKMML